jgi:hypothetical protein
VTNAFSDEKICDLCESPMIRSIAKKGARKGLPLWYCSDLTCPRIVNIDAPDEGVPAPRPGQSAQARFEYERAERNTRLRIAAPVLAAGGVLASTLAYWLSAAFAPWPYPFAMAVATVIILAWLLSRAFPEVVDWKHGAEAERRVGESLDSLEPLGFVTLYDRRLRGRYGNIDAITVGPPGVFVVESKWRGRAVEVINGRLETGNREQPDAIRQVTELALRVQVSMAPQMNRHRLTVSPIICIGNRKVEQGIRSGGVPVLDATKVAGYLRSLPPVLSPEEINELARELDYALPAFERRTA